MDKIKVLIWLDSHNGIIKINSDIHYHDDDYDAILDEGHGTKYAHAQNNYFEGGIYDENGNPKYKYVEGEGAVEFTAEEKAEFYPVQEVIPEKTWQEKYTELEEAFIELAGMVGGDN